jgi:hypothetical protein
MAEVDREPTEEIDEDEGRASDEEVEKETDEVSERAMRKLYNMQEGEIAKFKKIFGGLEGEIGLRASIRNYVDVADARYDLNDIKDQIDDFARRHRRIEIENRRAEARAYREEQVGTQERKGRLFARAKAISLLLGIAATADAVAATIVAIFVATHSNNQPGPPPEDGLTPEQRASLIGAVEGWRKLDDAAVWRAMADYCDSWNPSWQAQILMMDTIKKLSHPLNRPWVWQGDDALTYVRTLVGAYGSFTTPPPGENCARALYVAVEPIKYDVMNDGKLVPLPRQVAADLVELAITEIVLRSASRMAVHQAQSGGRGAI